MLNGSILLNIRFKQKPNGPVKNGPQVVCCFPQVSSCSVGLRKKLSSPLKTARILQCSGLGLGHATFIVFSLPDSIQKSAFVCQTSVTSVRQKHSKITPIFGEEILRSRNDKSTEFESPRKKSLYFSGGKKNCGEIVT